MKKRLAAVCTGVLAASLILAGCSASKGLETDELKITQYKEVEVDKVEDPEEVTDEAVESAIQRTLQAHPLDEGTVESGDTVIIDYVGKIDGVEFEGGTASDAPLEIGSGSFIPGFEDSIIGHAVGDVFDWEGAFPEDYHNPEYAGKPCVFTITVKGIAPELTDDFVQSVSEKSKTVDEYKEEIKKELEEEAQRVHDDSLSAAVWQKVMENTEVSKYPEDKVKEMSDSLIEYYKSAAEYYGMEYEDFIKQQMGSTVEEFEEQVDKAAKEAVKQTMAVEAIAEKEKLEINDKNYDEVLNKTAKSYGYETGEDFEAAFEDEEAVKETLLDSVVKEWLTEHCIQVAK